ncbi:GNAT family N-acetyltransferase [Planktothrix sp. FACHB-1355]|uniref:GNAT family N-acetyltransferase n=1 Tax=Aerosakkonema funiforme FACHB-1375 TaxID=2949571 RepID=A0A926ZFG1_9CYAN|nr:MULTISPECIES: GNAT family N-acetyltransferase [Oscillatoriales]MBD2180052.1 GNAT family N-acetyltransferase [Aerosakkonema funiforme FACHB-1375]MBD3562761.1 GNAT family N-acetyltransferase [Planktothrix sp. FACHB-1355]
MGLTIEPLDSRKHNRSTFCCGKESLDNYIRKQASQDLKKRVAMVFVLVDSPNTDVIAYYSLSSYTIALTELSESFAKILPRYPLLPATLLGRLAVDRTQQGKRIGELILLDALKKALEATSQVASLAVIAETLDEEAVKFYQKYGFEPFKQNPMKLYLPMQAVEVLCQTFNI